MVQFEKLKSVAQEEKIVDLAKDPVLRRRVFEKKMTLIKVSSMVLAVVMLLGVLVTPALADGDDDGNGTVDNDDDGVEDETESELEREVSVEVHAHEIEISSVLDTGEDTNGIEIELRAEGGVDIEFRYKNETNGVENEIGMELEFRDLIEFEDVNGNGGFDTGDVVRSQYDLRNTTYDDIVYSVGNTLDNETQHMFSIMTSDGIFKVVLHVVGSFASLDSGTLTPSEVKIDIMIQDYPFTEDTTHLALKTKLETETETEFDDETFDEQEDLAEGEDEVEMSSGDLSAYYSWAENATVDGIQKPVVVTNTTDDDGDMIIHFAYPHGDVIVHDPKLGVPYIGALPVVGISSMVLPYLLALVLGSVVIVLAISWRLRRNGRRGV